MMARPGDQSLNSVINVPGFGRELTATAIGFPRYQDSLARRVGLQQIPFHDPSVPPQNSQKNKTKERKERNGDRRVSFSLGLDYIGVAVGTVIHATLPRSPRTDPGVRVRPVGSPLVR